MKLMKLKRADFILIGILLIAALIFTGIILSNRKEGAEAVVTVNGKEVQHLPLNIDTEYVIGNSDDFNIVVIKNGKAYVSDASCPDKICVKTGEICYNGETIICLPHKMVVKIQGSESSELDDVAR